MKKSKRMIMAYIRINGVEKQLIDKAFKPVPKVGLVVNREFHEALGLMDDVLSRLLNELSELGLLISNTQDLLVQFPGDELIYFQLGQLKHRQNELVTDLKSISLDDRKQVFVYHYESPMEPRSISIGTYPHSPKGERFVYESTDEMKSEFISAVLAREHGLSRNNLTLNHEAGRK